MMPSQRIPVSLLACEHLFLRRSFVVLSSIEPNEMQLILLHFILAFTVGKSTRLGVSLNTKGNTKYQ